MMCIVIPPCLVFLDNTTSLRESTQPGVSIVNPSGASSYAGRASKMSNDPSCASTRVVGSTDVHPNMHMSSLVENDVVPLHNIDDVTNLFGVPLKSLSDIDEFVNDLYFGKHESWFFMTKEKSQEITDIVCNRYSFLESMPINLVESGFTYDGSLKVSYSSPLVSPFTTINVPQEVDNIDVAATFGFPLTICTSYVGAAGASAKDQPKVNSNFYTLVANPVFDGVNISIPRKVVKK
nr:hypothetical protein [Tanacetum cinerariifolium]